MTNTKEVLQKIHDSAAVRDVRFVRQHSVGEVTHQGDIYVHHVSDEHPIGKRLESLQLAPGTTKGSRHTLRGDVEVYEGVALPATWRTPKWLKEMRVDPHRIALGPAFIVRSRALGPHPEHSDYSLPPGRYQVTYQIDRKTAQRVAD